MKAGLTWDEFKKILNICDRDHRLIPKATRGTYENKGKCIRHIIPNLNFTHLVIVKITFHYESDKPKIFEGDNMYDKIVEWLNE